jgi:hypothetical protein
MSTQYTLTIRNNSLRYGSMCVFATPPDDKVQLGLKSLAWFSKAAHPNTSVQFKWSLDYSFVWSQTGELVTGVTFIASEYIDADPSNDKLNTAYFDMQGGAYLFGDVTKAHKATPGTLAISTSPTVPDSDAAIGIGIGGNPAMVQSATPNYPFTFIPKVRYWVAFGDYTEGQVLDVNAMTEIYELKFPINVYAKTLILDEGNTWSEGNTLQEYNDKIRAKNKA